MDKATEEHWRDLGEHILTDIQEWRRTHPKASFREIEDEVHERMSQLEAQVLQDTAQASKSREWSGVEQRCKNDRRVQSVRPHCKREGSGSGNCKERKDAK
jgi:hypothetical protein